MIDGRRNRLAGACVWLWLVATAAVLCTAAPADAQKAQTRLEVIDGARVLYLRGAPYDRGYEYGRLLADEIKFNITRYLNVGIAEHWSVPREFLKASAAKMEPFIPDEVKQEMRGIAVGAEVDYEDVLILNTHVDAVVHGVEATGQSAKAAQCSGIAVMGHWTSDGRVLHGHNVDWTTDEEIQKTAVLLVIAPEDGVPFCMPTHAGMVACNAGMNAAGITYSDMTSESADQRLNAMPLMIMARMLLEKARTLDEALSLLREWPDTCGWNMIITDAKGPDLRAIEISATHLKTFKPGDRAENTPTGAPIAQAVVRTNHFVDPEMLALAARRVRLTAEQGIVRTVADDSYRRYMVLGKRLRADKLSVEPGDIQAWLHEPPVGNPGNIQSMVFDPSNQEIWTANAAADGAPACDTRYSRVNLKPYFARCQGRSSPFQGLALPTSRVRQRVEP